jgi:integrase
LKQKTKAGALWSLKDTPVCDLTSQHISKWLNQESESRPGIAALVYRLLFACLNWSQEHPNYIGLVDVSTLKTRAVKQAVPKNKVRTGALEKEQLKNWFSEMRKIKNPVIAAFVQILLITGARRGELEHLKWEDVDFQWHSLTIRDKATTKGKDIGTRVIPLTQYANSLLQTLPRRNEWVFSSPTSSSGRMTEPRKSIDPALIAAGLDGLTLHDLRRSFATLTEWIEVPAGITAQIMGHEPSATVEKHYKRRPLDLLKQWHNKIEAWLLEQAGIEQPEYSHSAIALVNSQKGRS